MNALRPSPQAYRLSRKFARKYDRAIRQDPEARRFLRPPNKAHMYWVLMDQPADPLATPLATRYDRFIKKIGMSLPF